MKKKKNRINKNLTPFYKSILFWTIFSTVVAIIVGVANFFIKQNVTTFENSEIVKDSTNVIKFNDEGDYISGNKIKNEFEDNKHISEEYHISSSNQQGGITAGKVVINTKSENDSIPYMQNYYYKYHSNHNYKDNFVIEVRPKQGSWYPFVVGIPISEKEKVGLNLIYGPANKPPRFHQTHTIKTKSDDKNYHVIVSEQQADINHSFYILFKEKPSVLVFGPQHKTTKYKLDLSKKDLN